MANGNNSWTGTSHKLDRRSTIKYIGATIAGISRFSGLGMADADNHSGRELLREAKLIGNRQGPEARAQFLRDNDLPTGYSRTKFSLDEAETSVEGAPTAESLSGGVSPERVDCVDPTSCCGPNIM
jgi:hypothetical protein